MARAIPRHQPAVPGQQLIDSAVQLLKRGQHAQAETRLATLRRQLPANVRAMTLHGDALRELERFDDAIAAYQQAFDAGLQSPDLLLNLATCHNRLKQPDAAMELVQQVLHKQPDHAGALGIQGDVYRLQNQPVQARNCFRRALALQPNNPKLYLAAAHLDTVGADSPVFSALQTYLQDESLSAPQRARVLATLAKAYLDVGNDDQAFDYYQQANKIMDESLPPIKAELERLLAFTRQQFTPALFQKLSPFGSQTCPQIIVAGMSRSGKSLVESLFRGVDGVHLAGEEKLLAQLRDDILAPYQKRMDAWLADQTPDSIRRCAADYIKLLGDDARIKITTIPGDLWNLGLIGLLAPQVPIIFCVRGVLDLGITGFFQQYEFPEGYRYSYDLHQMGRQIACSEKVMEHWAQVLPNPVYLVDYEALTRNPQTVMNNLLDQLGLKRTQSYEEIVGANADLLGTISPIASTDAPMPITDRFIGIGERFRNKLDPMIKGYHTIVDQFPRHEPPATFPQPLPDTFIDTDALGPAPSETVSFDWQLPGQVTVLDNGAQLLRTNNVAALLEAGAFGMVVFDPAGDASVSTELQNNPKLQYVPQALLGNGQPGTLHASLDPQYNSTLKPLPADQLAQHLRQPAMALTQMPVQTFSLDAIDGLDSVDWLLLDERHDSLSILEHGQTVLSNTLLIQAGVAFQPIWQRQPSLAELSHWAARNGFRFHRLVDMEHRQAMPERTDLVQQPKASELCRAAVLLLPDEARMAALNDTQRLKLAFVLDTVYGIHDLSYDLLRQVGKALGENYLKARGFFDRRRSGPGTTQLAAVRRALQTGQFASQTGLLRQWATRYPQDPQVRRLHAELASWMGNHALAVSHLDKAISLAPDDLSIRLTGVEILLRGGMWWEADSMAQALLAHAPEHPRVQQLAYEALVAQPVTDTQAVDAALLAVATLEPSAAVYPAHDASLNDGGPTVDGLPEAIDADAAELIDGSGDEQTADQSLPARRLAVQAQLLALSGRYEQAWPLHEQALSLLEPEQAPLRTQLLLSKASSQYQAGLFDDSCHTLWHACNTRPYSPYTVAATRKFEQVLEHSQEARLQTLATLHQTIKEIWAGYKAENLKHAFGDFGLPYQSFEPLMLPGTRPAMHRLGVYGLEHDLPSDARALDIGCNHGFLLMGLAPQLSYGLGFDISQSCIEVGKAVASHLGHQHIHLDSTPFDKFVCKKPFDLVIACAVHHWIGIPLADFGAKLYSYCKPGGIVLLESQGIRRTTATEVDFENKASTIASGGFKVIRKGSLCDDGINYREFWVLKKE